MKSPLLLVIAIMASAIVHCVAQPTQAGVSQEETKAPDCMPEDCVYVEAGAKDARACNNRGILKQIHGDLHGAIADYSRAIELDPHFAAAWNNLGNARIAEGDLEGAIADYTHAIELDPYDASAFHNRGKARAAGGDMPGAVADYNRAAELDRKFAPPASIFETT